MDNIFIISPARCGSSWVAGALENAGYHNLFEFFNYDGDSLSYKLNRDGTSPYVAKVFTDELAKYPDQLNFNYYGQTWLMYRRNLVEHFLSFAVAMRTKQYNLSSNDTTEFVEITLNEVDYSYYNMILTQFVNYIADKSFDQIIAYEDMHQDVPALIGDKFKAPDIVKVSTQSQKMSMLTNNIDINRLEQIARDLNIASLDNFKPRCAEH